MPTHHAPSTPRGRTTSTFALAVAIAAASASADVLLVPQDHPTIQDALAEAQPGDEIVVAPGTHAGPVDLTDHAVTLRSAAGAEVTTITAPPGMYAVTMLGAGTGTNTLQGFTLTAAAPVAGVPGSGGVQANKAALAIVDCVFLGCNRDDGSPTTTVGGAIDAIASELVCSGSAFVTCGTPNDPGVFTSMGSSTFVGCSVSSAAGISYVTHQDELVLDGIELNAAPGGNAPPLLWAILGGAVVRNSDFSGAAAGLGTTTPRIVMFNAAAITIEQCVFHDWLTTRPLIAPASTTPPGVIGSSSLMMRNCTIIDNTIVTAAPSTTALIVGPGNTTMEACVVDGNTATASGLSLIPVVRISGGTATGAVLADCVFTDNKTAGAAVRVQGGSVQVDRCQFISNRGGTSPTSGTAGAALLIASSGATASRIADTDFVDNGWCGTGAAIHATGSTGLDVLRCAFVANAANPLEGAAGAVLSTTPSSRFHACRFVANTARTAGALRLGGGNSELVNCLFVDNAAIGSDFIDGAGAIWLSSAAELVVAQCTIADNSGNIGAAMVASNSTAEVALLNSIVWGNVGPPGAAILAGQANYTALSSIIQGGEAGGAEVDPLFQDAAGGNYAILPRSPALDAGDIDLLPEDVLDLDGDGDTIEPLPVDLALAARTVDGDGDGTATPDMGCFEHVGPMANDPDLNGDAVVDGADLALVLAAWGAASSPADLNDDGVVDGADLAIVLAAWG